MVTKNMKSVIIDYGNKVYGIFLQATLSIVEVSFHHIFFEIFSYVHFRYYNFTYVLYEIILIK